MIFSSRETASGTSSVLAIGPARPARTRSSNALSSAAESEPPGWITGFTSSPYSPKLPETILISWLFIQLMLPEMVLISPLCASMRNGCARRHCGNVLVE
ncbi:hypothetical protein D3C83_48210 [compost metagenome]